LASERDLRTTREYRSSFLNNLMRSVAVHQKLQR
jgi:hypothetical protein